MKKKRIISFLVLVALLFSFLFSGCFDSNAAKNSADIYCSLIFKSDAKDLQKIGVSDSEKDNIVKEYEDKIKDQLRKNVLLMQYSASDEQLNSICEAYKEALSKITYETKQISKSGDEAEVEISTTNFDIKKIDEQTAMDALDETDKMEFTSNEEENKKFGEIYLSKLTEGLKNAEVSSDKSSNTFKFKKVNRYWIADDQTNFGYKLVELAVNKDNLNIDEESISPKESAEVLWNLVIKEDSSGMEKLGYSKAFGERIIKNINKNDFKTFKKESGQSGISLSDDQLQGMITALRSAISKNSVNFEEVSKTDNSAQVKVSSTFIDRDQISKDAVNITTSQALSNGIRDKQKLTEAYVANLIDSINKGQISSTTAENTFSFTKVGNIWLPSDTTNYTESISKMVMK
ncbi:DUF5105 domain-containing protein [Clostridium sp. 2-1]|uniref:DUF5105 domain-containing protein n=1 Tax=Clostridium TaxID=1485 RepID=UPI000CDA9F88|nr:MULTISPECIES: DUF5105 domain-containing protein [Clostridium]MBN7573146.1 DUF5105 domain-containing protein [Clostridium beijerinckii]MBN7578485.1 DUF5105 domain-containing protein [Clostridium beijerinckii]MBN7582920.1 DUF5105 domain-containing protein [Clostridium beijerinckii]MBO0519085.1 DUF5105 domain-containing protein [Clostridium beijerinckii]POO93349.1 DUF5105 domain-containing protein [Clostridium sp. 2-1]